MAWLRAAWHAITIVHLILTSEAALRRRYGDPAWQNICDDIDTLLRRRRARGIASQLLYLEQGWPSSGIGAVSPEPAAIAAMLAAIDAWLHERGDAVESLLILGDPAIVPFAAIDDPVPDSDRMVLTDWPYGLADADSWLARWPVGRLPDRPAAQPQLLRALLAFAAAGHSQPSAAPARLLGFSAESWYHVSRHVLADIGVDGDLLVVPPELSLAVVQTLIVAAGVVYCNLHGLPDQPAWYGHAPGGQLVPALRPSDLVGLILARPVVFSQACYGAALPAGATGESLALSFLQCGALAFIGSAVLSYGAFELPIEDSDLLAQQFLLALGGAESIGAALQLARIATVRAALLAQGFLDDDDRKVLQSFVLYGDPTLPVPVLLRGGPGSIRI